MCFYSNDCSSIVFYWNETSSTILKYCGYEVELGLSFTELKYVYYIILMIETRAMRMTLLYYIILYEHNIIMYVNNDSR